MTEIQYLRFAYYSLTLEQREKVELKYILYSEIKKNDNNTVVFNMLAESTINGYRYSDITLRNWWVNSIKNIDVNKEVKI